MTKSAIAALVCLAAIGAPAFAQVPAAPSGAYQPPRTADGKPDLTGFWTNVSLTSLERAGSFRDLVIPEDRAVQLERATAERSARSNDRTDPTSGAPRAGQDVGGYNSFWADAGTHYARINGQARSSWIVDPPSGRLPYSPEGRRTFDTALSFVRNTFDGPETRPMAERCLVGFGSTGGPPMINVMYNNTYQFVQTPQNMVISVEMNHDARIIPLGGANQRNPQWLGNSRGRWEGDTFVVETTNFNPGESLRTFFANSFYLSPDGVVVEKFTRVSENQILYEFTVTDPKIYTQPWRAEMALNRSEGRPFEYACHEGNYALPGILAGARKNDREGRANDAVDANE
jgi:hypothetical protein